MLMAKLLLQEAVDDLIHYYLNNLGLVVQSIVSLTSSLRGQLVKYFTTL